jgi:NADP-dependent 3-hydroxy acid dehydrogenase YdfG
MKLKEEFMQRRFVDKVVVITGASSGIGKATAIEFARHGAALVLTARRETALEQTADECRRAGSDAMVCGQSSIRAGKSRWATPGG